MTVLLSWSPSAFGDQLPANYTIHILPVPPFHNHLSILSTPANSSENSYAVVLKKMEAYDLSLCGCNHCACVCSASTTVVVNTTSRGEENADYFVYLYLMPNHYWVNVNERDKCVY